MTDTVLDEPIRERITHNIDGELIRWRIPTSAHRSVFLIAKVEHECQDLNPSRDELVERVLAEAKPAVEQLVEAFLAAVTEAREARKGAEAETMEVKA